MCKKNNVTNDKPPSGLIKVPTRSLWALEIEFFRHTYKRGNVAFKSGSFGIADAFMFRRCIISERSRSFEISQIHRRRCLHAHLIMFVLLTSTIKIFLLSFYNAGNSNKNIYVNPGFASAGKLSSAVRRFSHFKRILGTMWGLERKRNKNRMIKCYF